MARMWPCPFFVWGTTQGNPGAETRAEVRAPRLLSVGWDWTLKNYLTCGVGGYSLTSTLYRAIDTIKVNPLRACSDIFSVMIFMASSSIAVNARSYRSIFVLRSSLIYQILLYMVVSGFIFIIFSSVFTVFFRIFRRQVAVSFGCGQCAHYPYISYLKHPFALFLSITTFDMVGRCKIISINHHPPEMSSDHKMYWRLKLASIQAFGKG